VFFRCLEAVTKQQSAHRAGFIFSGSQAKMSSQGKGSSFSLPLTLRGRAESAGERICSRARV